MAIENPRLYETAKSLKMILTILLLIPVFQSADISRAGHNPVAYLKLNIEFLCRMI